MKRASEPQVVLEPEHQELFEDIYRRYWSDVCRYVRGRFGSGPPDPEEVAQSVFARLIRHRSLPELEEPRAFLFRCAANLVMDHHRSNGMRESARTELAHRAREAQVSAFSPEHVHIGRERLAILEAALAQMPRLRRRVFLLVRVEGLTCAEVAKQCGLSENAVYQHVFRAMRTCDAALEAAEKGKDPI